MELTTRIIIRNDSTVNWSANDDQVLLKGEMGIEFTESGEPKLKIGDGVSTWAELKYFGGETAVKFFEVTPEAEETHEQAIARIVGDAEVKDGSFAVVKVAITEDRFEHTAYVYSEGSWKAMDGNYNAESVYFDQDLVTTAAVGNIKLTNGQATIAAKGKNLKQVFDAIFVKESNPTTTQPSVSIKSTEAAAYEVGTKVTPTWDATFSAGKYSYGPATGVTVTSWEISDTEGNTADTEDGTFPEITVGDDTDYAITAKANYGDGVIPQTNTGNPYAAGQIKAGSKSATISTKISGYRNTFFKSVETQEEITSDLIRSLTASNAGLANGSTFDIEVPVGAVRTIFAYPADLQDVTGVVDVNGLGARIEGSFTKSVVSVEGANDYQAIDYKVYVMDYTVNDTLNTFTVTI